MADSNSTVSDHLIPHVPPPGWAWPEVDQGSPRDAMPICNASQSPDTGDECVRPLVLNPAWLDYPVYGVLSPSVIIFTVITNSLVCVVLLRPNMRSATNVLLVAMALSDTMTGLWPLPCYINFYTLGRATDYIPYNWCFVYHCLTEYLPIVCHTASIWLTVGLAVQRYICVCHSVVAKKLCTVPNVVRAVIAIYAASFVSQLTRFVELRYAPIRLALLLNTDIELNVNGTPVTSSLNNNTLTPMSSPSTPSLAEDLVSTTSGSPSTEAIVVVGCAMKYVQFVADHMNVYFNVYFWFRVIFIHLIPCTALIILNALLVHTMRLAQRRRRQLLAQNRKSECRRLAESNMTTMMLVAVVGVFLLAEVPLAVTMVAMIVNNTLELQLIDDYVGWIVPLILNLFILLSYPLNFFIYCAMSRQFRETFKSLCCCGTKTGSDRNIEQTTLYVTVGAECPNGNKDARKTSRV